MRSSLPLRFVSSTAVCPGGSNARVPVVPSDLFDQNRRETRAVFSERDALTGGRERKKRTAETLLAQKPVKDEGLNAEQEPGHIERPMSYLRQVNRANSHSL